MKLPFVSRAAFDQAVERAVAAENRATVAQGSASQSWDEAKALIVEARAAMRDAIAMSKIASASLFGREETGEVAKPLSVSENDRRRAREIREQGTT